MVGMHYLKVVFATGVVPGKWFGRFDERMDGWKAASAASDNPLAHVLDGTADIGIVRLPGGWDGLPETNVDAAAMEALDVHRVVLYEETPGVAVPKEHAVEAVGENEAVTLQDIADETVLYRGVDPAAVRENLEVVAANVGVVVAPRPLLRGVNRRGVVHRSLEGVEGTSVALVWRRDRDDDVIQQFVGICRGRRASSSR
jgi:DNA-binding transcriptional LysR family regulator